MAVLGLQNLPGIVLCTIQHIVDVHKTSISLLRVMLISPIKINVLPTVKVTEKIVC